MKNWMRLAVLVLALTFLAGCTAMGHADDQKTFVTSFYPMYVFTLNVTRDIPGVTVVNMADQSAGCLHDYQLQTRDMVVLEKADALVINGGGMEQFMDKVIAQRPDLPVINASKGIDMLCAGEEHGHEGHDHDHEVFNAHVWLDAKLAIEQVRRIADGLAQADSARAQAYQQNAQAYVARLEQLDAEIKAQLAPIAGSRIVTFHEAFDYFARAYQLEVAGVIAGDSGEEPATREIAAMCDLVKETGVKALFTEPQYPSHAAQTIARETGAAVYTLDPIVSGDGSMESYENVMRANALVLMEALFE